MNELQLSLIILLTLLVACDSPEKTDNIREYQAVSLLGDTLYAPPLNPDTESRFKSNLKAAEIDYETNPEDVEAIIWYGRRTAYLGNYRKAIDIFSEGVEKHPEDARMYRHRGHRYITLRQFDKAINDLKKAVDLIRNTQDRVEPDGLPNAQNQPRSTLQTNIWYHLGLAHYLEGNFDESAEAYRNCLEASDNDDMLVATSYWLYMSLRRAGYDEQAGKVLEPIDEEMNLLENDSYHSLLLVFKGIFKADKLLQEVTGSNTDALHNATIGYGIGNWHYINGRKQRAHKIFKQVYEGDQWNAFGYIAAEADLDRLFGN